MTDLENAARLSRLLGELLKGEGHRAVSAALVLELAARIAIESKGSTFKAAFLGSLVTASLQESVAILMPHIHKGKEEGDARAAVAAKFMEDLGVKPRADDDD